MCNACGFYCCGSDEFGGCGCEHCPDSACWPDDEDEWHDDDDQYEGSYDCAPKPSRLRCDAVSP